MVAIGTDPSDVPGLKCLCGIPVCRRTARTDTAATPRNGYGARAWSGAAAPQTSLASREGVDIIF
jgi:hypothetical protein